MIFIDFLGIVFVFGLFLYYLRFFGLLCLSLYAEIMDYRRETMTESEKILPTKVPINNKHEPVSIKNLNGRYEFTYLGQRVIQRLQKFGTLYSYELPDRIIYRLRIKNKYTTIISFVKALGTYGYKEDLWEAATIRNERVRYVKGYLTDADLLEYVKEIDKYIKDDLKTKRPVGLHVTWFLDLPMEA